MAASIVVRDRRRAAAPAAAAAPGATAPASAAGPGGAGAGRRRPRSREGRPAPAPGRSSRRRRGRRIRACSTPTSPPPTKPGSRPVGRLHRRTLFSPSEDRELGDRLDALRVRIEAPPRPEAEVRASKRGRDGREYGNFQVGHPAGGGPAAGGTPAPKPGRRPKRFRLEGRRRPPGRSSDGGGPRRAALVPGGAGKLPHRADDPRAGTAVFRRAHGRRAMKTGRDRRRRAAGRV